MHKTMINIRDKQSIEHGGVFTLQRPRLCRLHALNIKGPALQISISVKLISSSRYEEKKSFNTLASLIRINGTHRQGSIPYPLNYISLVEARGCCQCLGVQIICD